MKNLEAWAFGGMDGDLMEAKKAGMESRGTKLRDWYRKGQAMFRQVHTKLDATQRMDGSRLVYLNEFLQQIRGDTQKEGFMMGWQSDQWAWDNNKPFSVEGVDHYLPEDLSGHTTENEGSAILAATSQ